MMAAATSVSEFICVCVLLCPHKKLQAVLLLLRDFPVSNAPPSLSFFTAISTMGTAAVLLPSHKHCCPTSLFLRPVSTYLFRGTLPLNTRLHAPLCCVGPRQHKATSNALFQHLYIYLATPQISSPLVSLVIATF